MKKRKIIILTSIILIIFSGNILANTTLLTIPTADVRGNAYIYGEVSSSRRQVEMAYTVNPEIEVGALFRDDSNDGASIGPLAKAVFLEETDSTPALAVGIRNQDLYFVSSMNIGWGIQGHLGIGNGELSGLFVGVNTVLNPLSVSQGNDKSIPPVTLIGEYANEELNVGLSMRLQDNINFDLGLLSLLNMNTLKLGLGYNF